MAKKPPSRKLVIPKPSKRGSPTPKTRVIEDAKKRAEREACRKKVDEDEE